MITKDILSTTYILLDNASEEELDLIIAIEKLASVLTTMMYEEVFGNLDTVIRKATVDFNDTTGTVNNTLTEFGDVVFLRFNNAHVDECPVSQLELYTDAGIQRVAFWTDESTSTRKISLSIGQVGTLDVWYEPYRTQEHTLGSNIDYDNSLKWCIATRLAVQLLPYVKYKDQFRMINKPILTQQLKEEERHWTQIYLEKVNRIGTAKPFQRLPFMAQRYND